MSTRVMHVAIRIVYMSFSCIVDERLEKKNRSCNTKLVGFRANLFHAFFRRQIARIYRAERGFINCERDVVERRGVLRILKHRKTA